MANETRLKQVEDRKESLKQDHFVTTTSHGLSWASENRKSVIVTTSILLAVIVVVVVGFVIANSRSNAAAVAFGSAMQTYEAPVATPDQPADPGVKTYGSVAERAKAANAQFVAAAGKYSWTKDGENSLYFAGITYKEMGENASAETDLKKVAGSWNSNLASLAKLALADLYQQSGRAPQAIDLYNQLTAKPTDSVPAGLAQIQLAELYTAQGKIAEAHKIYAQLKDKDKDAKGNPGPAGALAAQKLNPAPTAPPQL